ncbi:MAG: hypothetical protein HZC28_04975 [Spirochaetes bacterium]|nr:hypothetical protein [Spirochaetota bacterium]
MNRTLLIIICVAAWALSCAQNPAMPGARPFRMGFTPWPYEFTAVAVERTYSFIAAHGDIISHHLDNGVPWDEMLTNGAFPAPVEKEIADRLSRKRSGQKIFLSLNPLELDRRNLAGYWNTATQMPLAGLWKSRSFSDSNVITAYINYCRKMIDRFQPDYMAYTIEANVGFSNTNDALFTNYLVLASNVYTTLKSAYPALPVMLTIVAADFNDGFEELKPLDEKLLQFSDFVAVSTYPYFDPDNAPQIADTARIKSGWLKEIAALAPAKPFAIAETGFIAETYDSLGLMIPANSKWQADYINLLYRELTDLNAVFAVWFVPQDYDKGSKQLASMGIPAYDYWRDTGLLDGTGTARPSLTVWDEWYRLPKSR